METTQALEAFSDALLRAPAARQETAVPEEASALRAPITYRLGADTTPPAPASASPRARLVVVLSQDTLDARHELLRKQFTRGLSAGEERALRYLDWQVDAALSASAAPDIARLERLLGQVEDAALRIQNAAETCTDRYPKAFPRAGAR